MSGRDSNPVSMICFKSHPMTGHVLSYNLSGDKDMGSISANIRQ